MNIRIKHENHCYSIPIEEITIFYDYDIADLIPKIKEHLKFTTFSPPFSVEDTDARLDKLTQSELERVVTIVGKNIIGNTLRIVLFETDGQIVHRLWRDEHSSTGVSPSFGLPLSAMGSGTLQALNIVTLLLYPDKFCEKETDMFIDSPDLMLHFKSAHALGKMIHLIWKSNIRLHIFTWSENFISGIKHFKWAENFINDNDRKAGINRKVVINTILDKRLKSIGN